MITVAVVLVADILYLSQHIFHFHSDDSIFSPIIAPILPGIVFHICVRLRTKPALGLGSGKTQKICIASNQVLRETHAAPSVARRTTVGHVA